MGDLALTATDTNVTEFRYVFGTVLLVLIPVRDFYLSSCFQKLHSIEFQNSFTVGF